MAGFKVITEAMAYNLKRIATVLGAELTKAFHRA
jgi:hypothetical protein